MDDLHQAADEGQQLSAEQIITFERPIDTESKNCDIYLEQEQVVDGQAKAAKEFVHEQQTQMTEGIRLLKNLQPTPTTTLPTQPLPRALAAPYARPLDRLESWIREWQGQKWRDNGKQPVENIFDSGNNGNGDQGPPKPTPRDNPEPSDQKSNDGHGGGRGGGGGGASWRPEPNNPIDPRAVILAQAIGIAMAMNGKRQAEVPQPVKNLKHQNIEYWLLQCEYYFGQNPNQWKSDQDRIKYALGKMDGKDVSAFTLTYQMKMTRELGYLKVEGYEYWEAFYAECILRFELTYEGERALPAMDKVQYKNNIDRYLLEMENLNTHVHMSGIT
ncbi:hypothetical protein B9Z19DRAFT_1120776 [Tuber borchii]|uniref:Uncharacterized protein n=1 Tax=Tuber borchii TaxID=42251 RepID=A0A2T7A3X7_TUBBO|nr:hypothetical protein B9Z19DRAFT_1120776 [Tuber borchii]